MARQFGVSNPLRCAPFRNGSMREQSKGLRRHRVVSGSVQPMPDGSLISILRTTVIAKFSNRSFAAVRCARGLCLGMKQHRDENFSRPARMPRCNHAAVIAPKIEPLKSGFAWTRTITSI